jgi:DNA-binding transcriptional LysR family regulator
MNSDPFNELNVEVLFNDKLVVAAGMQTRWARRRKIDLADLARERWILTAPGTWNYQIVEEAFRAWPRHAEREHEDLVCSSSHQFRSSPEVRWPLEGLAKFSPGKFRIRDGNHEAHLNGAHD